MTSTTRAGSDARPALSWIETARAVAFKELRQLSRDPWLIVTLLIWQLMSGTVMAFVDPVIRNLPAVVVDQDRTAESRDLVARVRATQSFDVRFYTEDRERARRYIRAGSATVALVIPPSYGRLRASGGEVSLLALVDGSDSTSSAQAISTLEGVVGRMNEKLREEAVASEGLTPSLAVLFNPARLVSRFTLPGALAMALGIAYAAKVSRSIARERTNGHLEMLFMTPMDPRGFVIGKTLPWLAVTIANAAAYLAGMRWLAAVPIEGSALLLAICMLLYILAILSLGALVGAAHDLQGATWTLNMLARPSTLLSGYVLPLFSLPVWLRPVSYLFPQTHFIEIARGICLRGAKLVDLLPHVLFLLVTPAVFIFAASRRFATLVQRDGSRS